jgi:hypothetical protein
MIEREELMMIACRILEIASHLFVSIVVLLQFIIAESSKIILSKYH